MTVIEMILKDTTGSLERCKVDGKLLKSVLNDYRALQEIYESFVFDDIVEYYYSDYSGEHLITIFNKFVEDEDDFKILTSDVGTFDYSEKGLELYT